MNDQSSKQVLPLDPSDEAPIDRYCDLILKGGVTDGVIYPWAIMALAQHYRFRSIGGTSVGAMAAALTAAAEYSRRYGSVRGFNEVMLKIPEQLAKKIGDDTTLFSLFQPTNQATHRLFDLFVAIFSSPKNLSSSETRTQSFQNLLKTYREWFNRGTFFGAVISVAISIIDFFFQTPMSGRVAPVLFGVQCFVLLLFFGLTFEGLRKKYLSWFQYSVFLSAFIALGAAAYSRPAPDLLLYLMFGVSHLTLALCIIFSTVLLVLGIRLRRDLLEGLLPKGIGLCTGKQVDPDGAPALIEWLHKGIQGAAGRPLNQPLTFKDLWNAPSGPGPSSEPANSIGLGYRSIDLQMVTTNITYGRPYGLPLAGSANRLFFRSEELSAYFPDEVMAHLLQYAKPYVNPVPGETDFFELPQGDLPIIVATRLSLSVPILFKAVPLWALKTHHTSASEPFEPCWFSDGGICSNFPIHQFDAAMPRWPTFGIMLSDATAPNGDSVWISEAHNDEMPEGSGSKKTKASGAPGALVQLGNFFKDLIYTAKDWNDNNSARLPGVRDRVVHVKLPDGESNQAGQNVNLGGLNLRLSSEEIMGMARDYGLKAGQLLVKKFLEKSTETSAPPRTLAASAAWREHRWVRINNFLTAMRSRMMGFQFAAESADYSGKLSEQIKQARTSSPLPDDPKIQALTFDQESALAQAQNALSKLELSLNAANAVQNYQPSPALEILLRSPL